MRCVRDLVTCALFTLLACSPGPAGPSQPQPSGADAKVAEPPAGEPASTPPGTPPLPEGVVVEPKPSPGSTPDPGPKPADGAVVQCTPETRKGGMCTREFRPVCGTLADKTTKTFSNPCVACSDTNVVSHVPGECAGGAKEQAKEQAK